jgi:hypothetical protein
MIPAQTAQPLCFVTLFCKEAKEEMQTQLKVIKEDGSIEEYFHTKVLGTISNALGGVGQTDMFLAEQLAEVVTYYLYHNLDRREVASSEVHSIIKAVLSATNYDDAAVALNEHYLGRKVKRSRVEVVYLDVRELADAEQLTQADGTSVKCRWDKSRIVEDLTAKHGISQQTARTIAALVEERVFKIGLTRVPVSLVKQLVLGDTAAVLQAERQLQST